MADMIPHAFFRSLMEKEQDLNATDVIKVGLVDNTATPTVDLDKWTDYSGDELAASGGYTTGGDTVTGAVTDSDANDNCKFDISDPTWTASGGTLGGVAARYAVVYNSTTGDVIYVIDLGADQTITDGQQFTIQIDADGLFTVA